MIGEKSNKNLDEFKPNTSQILTNLEDLVLIGTNQKDIDAMNDKSLLDLTETFKGISKLDKLILHHQFQNQHYKMINKQLFNKKTTINHLILHYTRIQPLNFENLKSLKKFSIVASSNDNYQIDGKKLIKLYVKCPNLHYLRLPYSDNTGIIEHICKKDSREQLQMRVNFEGEVDMQLFRFTQNKMTAVINSAEENTAFGQFAAKRKFQEIEVLLNADVKDLFCYNLVEVSKMTISVSWRSVAATIPTINPFAQLVERLQETPADQLASIEWIEVTLLVRFKPKIYDLQQIRDGIVILREKLPKMEKLNLQVYGLREPGVDTTIHSLAIDVCGSADTNLGPTTDEIKCNFSKWAGSDL